MPLDDVPIVEDTCCCCLSMKTGVNQIGAVTILLFFVTLSETLLLLQLEHYDLWYFLLAMPALVLLFIASNNFMLHFHRD